MRCLVATAVLVSASSVQATSEAPNVAAPAGQPALTIQAEPPLPAIKLNVPAAPVILERPPLPASEAKGLPAPAAAAGEKPTLAVEAPAPVPVSTKAAEAPANPAPATLERPPVPASPVTADKPALPAQATASAQAAAPNNAGVSDEDRAKEILINEQRGTKPKLHPLQTQSPDHNIVICEAGCGGSGARIVYKRPNAAIRSALADPAKANAPLTKNAECRGGCDASPNQKQASLGGGAPALLNDAAGSWLTTVEPSAAAAAPAVAPKPHAGKSLKEDWMARINRERAAANQGPQTIMPHPETEVKEPLITEPSQHRER